MVLKHIRDVGCYKCKVDSLLTGAPGVRSVIALRATYYNHEYDRGPYSHEGRAVLDYVDKIPTAEIDYYHMVGFDSFIRGTEDSTVNEGLFLLYGFAPSDAFWFQDNGDQDHIGANIVTTRKPFRDVEQFVSYEKLRCEMDAELYFQKEAFCDGSRKVPVFWLTSNGPFHNGWIGVNPTRKADVMKAISDKDLWLEDHWPRK